MIYWSFVDFSLSFNLEEMDEPSRLLGDREKQEYSRLRVPKRKLEWLGIRLAVKELILNCQPALERIEFDRVEVIKEAGGVPFVEVNHQRLTGCISVSHSHGFGLCAFSPEFNSLGADLEYIENRPLEFIDDYFTSDEIGQLEGLRPANRDLAVTLIWSAKEAVFKALAKGLALDTRSVEIGLNPHGLTPNNSWQRLGLNSKLIENPSLQVFWQREGNFVQTISLPADQPAGFIRLSSMD